MAITDSIFSDDITKLTKPRKEKGVEYAQASTGSMTDAALRGKGGVDVEGLVEQSRKAAEAEKRLDEITKQEAAAKKGASAAKEAALGRRYSEIRAQYEPELAKPAPEFAPSKETVANLGSLGGMLMVLGAMSGNKGMVGATGAMNAMAGMLQGYQQGRKELFDREKTTFEQNFKVWQTNRQIIKETFDRAIKYAPYDLQKATDEAVGRLNSVGATTLAASVKKNGLQQTATAVQQADAQFNQVAMPIVNQITAAQFPLGVTQTAAAPQQPMTKEQAQAAKTQFEQAKQEAELRAKYTEKPERERSTKDRMVSVLNPDDPKGAPILVPESEVQRAYDEGTPYTPAPRSGKAVGEIQFRYNSAVASATEVAANDLEAYASSPLMAKPPAAAEVLTNPSTSLTEAATKFFAQRITPAQDRATQQNLAGLIIAAANIQAGGRPGGVTQARITELEKIAPRAGDPKINTYMFLAMMKQEFRIAVKELEVSGGTKEQLDLARENKKRADELITWSISDINRILADGGPTLISPKTQKLIYEAKTRSEFEKRIKSEIRRPEGARPAQTGAGLQPPPAEVLQQAQEAIREGRDRNAVINKMRELGYSPEGL